MEQISRKYRIELKPEKCIGDGLCHEGADGTFDIDHKKRCAIVKDVLGNTAEDIFFAAWNCPNGCITLYDTESGEMVWPGKITREEFNELARRKRALMDEGEWSFWRDLGGGD